MWTGLPRCNSREPRPAQDTGQLPPWLKNAQDSAVVARLRRDLEARGGKPLLGNNAGRVPVDQAEKEADRLRMELSDVKGQLDNSEMASAKLVVELLSSKRELKAARDELVGSAIAAENVAKRVEADLATLHSELEVVRSELAGKVSELNEMRPQLDLARMQLRIFQEAYIESSSQVSTLKMHNKQAGRELAVVKTHLGTMNKILEELNKKHSQADQISKLDAELESAQNAQVVLQDASWRMKRALSGSIRIRLPTACVIPSLFQ